MKVINIMEQSHKIRDIEVLKYFKNNSHKYLIYKKGNVLNKVFLAKLEDGNLVDIDKNDSSKLQEIIKILLSPNKSVDTLQNKGYKELSMDELTFNYSERGFQVIAVNDEQYQNLIAKIVKKKRKLKKIPLIILLIVLILIVAVINYFLWFKDLLPNPLKDDIPKITFITNSDYTIDSVIMNKGEVLPLYQYLPTKEGYDFVGWYTDSTLTTVADDLYYVDKDTSLYAKWEIANQIGDVVTTVDDQEWFILSATEEEMTLLSVDCFDLDTPFDRTSACIDENNCSTSLNDDLITFYLQFNSGLSSYLQNDDVRLPTREEIEQLSKEEEIQEKLYSCKHNRYWVMTIADDNQLYTVNTDGNFISTNVNESAGLKVVVTISKDAIK